MSKATAFGLLAASLITTGCATRGYVRQQTEPLKQQVDELALEQSKQGEQLDKTGRELQETKVIATDARDTAKQADTRALEANTKAESADQKAGQNTKDIEALRHSIANIDDYSVSSVAIVHFGFDQDELTPEARSELDQFAAKMDAAKRFFFAIEGFTDQVGPPNYNRQLSKRRAERVAQYLIEAHNIPVYRVFQVGLGESRPLENENTREEPSRGSALLHGRYGRDQRYQSALSSQ